MSRILTFKDRLQGTSAFDFWPLVLKKIFKIVIKSTSLYLKTRVDSNRVGAGAIIWLGVGVLAWLGEGVPLSEPISSSDLFSDLQPEGIEPKALLQEQELNATARVALQELDFDVIYMICLIGWAFLNGLADPLGLE